MAKTSKTHDVPCQYCECFHCAEENDQCPSPESIRTACLWIQSTWNESEHDRRRKGAPDPDLVHFFTCRGRTSVPTGASSVER
jgi:hypothetical protein